MFRCSYIFFALVVTIKFSYIQCQTCAPNQCPKSAFNENLVVTPDQTCYDSGDQVTLNCSGAIGGPPFNTCGGGMYPGWTVPTSTTCEVFTCGRPSPIGEGLSVSPDKNSYDARETVTYSCKEGYIQTGADQAACDSQDTWNPPTVPVCAAICAEPAIPHGNITGTGPFSEGDSTQVKCDESYSLESGTSSTITCGNGTWNNIPQCFASCDVPDVSNGDITTTGPFSHGESAAVDCDEGYTLNGTSSSTITCQDGAWDPVPECYGFCYLPVIPNSDAEAGKQLTHGTQTSIQCDTGYSYEQQTSFDVNCNNGTFGGDLPDECHEDCGEPVPPSEGSVSGGNRHGETISYECDEGYVLNGTDSATCTDGTWSADVPTCYQETVTTCEAPENVGEGLILIPDKSSYNVNDVLTYYCPEGTTLVGPEQVNCTETGEWHPPDPPVCHEDCEEPVPPSEGSVSGGNRHGETISYECNEGYILNGTDSATCTDGTWSADVPTCYQETVTTCEAPENVGEGLMLIPERSSYNVNDVLTYYCPEGTTLKGPEQATCTENGEWHPPDPPVCNGGMIHGTWSSFVILIFSTLLALNSL